MQRRAIRRGLSLAAATSLGTLLLSFGSSVTSAPAGASCTSSAAAAPAPTRQGKFLGIVPKASNGSGVSCANVAGGGTPVNEAKKFKGKPPLINHAGTVMGSNTTPGDVTVTPIYWDPSSTLPGTYMTHVNHYVRDVAHDNGSLPGALTNVYSVDEQLGINYDIKYANSGLYQPKTDTDAFPPNGCTPDSRVVYNDSSHYSHCLTDAQLQTELTTYLSANGMASTLTRLYLIMLPKGVESCFNSGSGTGSGCSTPWVGTGFCGYHSSLSGPNPPVYADLPFPSYGAPGAPFTCAGTVGGVVESPNLDPDADVIISIVSHEVNEAITDPYGSAWFDSSGAEIGDECAYIYGTLVGTAGQLYNQTINGNHYMTQEEASNENYTFAKKKPCVQAVDLPVAVLKVKPKSPAHNTLVTFDGHKSQGGGLNFTWNFGDGSLPVNTGSTNTTTHTYTAAGNYTVTLTVNDVVGLQNTSGIATQIITVK
ncbi:MAG TPA: PKD domain-containing protein [Acidimicrobiales bacterium]|nr:PKD domain-containing protein [Acidimicrobiales bacterium]